MVRILITGSNGQVGSEIIEFLRKTTDCNILATDITQPKEQVEGVQYEYMDVKESFSGIIKLEGCWLANINAYDKLRVQ